MLITQEFETRSTLSSAMRGAYPIQRNARTVADAIQRRARILSYHSHIAEHVVRVI
jgi:hypothetical protein